MLAWVCKCHLAHEHKAHQCRYCGEYRWEALARIRAARETAREPVQLGPELVAKLEALHDRWVRGDAD